VDVDGSEDRDVDGDASVVTEEGCGKGDGGGVFGFDIGWGFGGSNWVANGESHGTVP